MSTQTVVLKIDYDPQITDSMAILAAALNESGTIDGRIEEVHLA